MDALRMDALNRKLSRRALLARSAAIVASGGLLPYFYSGGSKAAEAKGDRLGVAAIGTGGRGAYVGHRAARRGRIVACCDVDRRRAETFAARYDGHCQVYADYRRVLDRKDVDVLTVGTPDHWHAKIVIDALRAGKDVYCEKPLTLTIDEGKQICRTVRETRRVVQVGTQQRSEDDGVFLQAVALARSGYLGKKLRAVVSLGAAPRGGPFAPAPTPATLDWEFWLGQSPKVPYCPQRAHYDFRWWFEYAGGQVTYWGVHHVDIAMWALGLDETGPVRIEGAGQLPDVSGGFNVPSTFRSTMRFAGGATIVLDSGKNALRIEGDSGAIVVDHRRLTGKPVEGLSPSQREWLQQETVRLLRGKQPGNHMANFFECVKDRSLPASDVFTHHRALSACHLCNIAMRLKRSLDWDPLRQDFVGDSEASSLLSREQRKPYTIDA
jgi:predicted dehydrogenase